MGLVGYEGQTASAPLGRTYDFRLRVGMSRLRVRHARGISAHHFVPYDAEFAPEDEGG